VRGGVRRFFEDLNKGEVEALLAHLAPGFEMAVPEEMGVEPRTYSAKAPVDVSGVRRAIRGM
jgi:hypothetical protein